jgi:hypothetical protein
VSVLSNISLLRSSEVEDIIEGRDEKYKAVAAHAEVHAAPKWVNLKNCPAQ